MKIFAYILQSGGPGLIPNQESEKEIL